MKRGSLHFIKTLFILFALIIIINSCEKEDDPEDIFPPVADFSIDLSSINVGSPGYFYRSVNKQS